ncbi:C40 family peptidase [Actinomycetospora termitidis]|uniref:C40 family peptidase n=1 Tax=Actinomycetospora termitidis TaxID=3053470 RepID=A0ABT7MLP5_9PSEU|nr:C40 family peptidase [Actinomycetospora sp. Odt1-22]MDL5160483.1 C40 family peptidase [Actinomycetospora sp. Odt1-22]
MDRRRLGLLVGSAVTAYLLFLAAPLILVTVLISGGLGAAGSTCDGPGGTAAGTDGTGAALNGGDQLAYAQLITSIVAGRGLPQQAAVVAIATAAQESRLGQAGMNTAVDHDSLGLFQQRPSAGWGSPAQVKDPTYATNKFLDGLVGIGGWATMPVTKAAQTVQRSAFPDAYAQWEAQARDFATRFWPPGTPPGGNPAAAATQAAAAPSAAGAQTCPGEGGDGLAPGSGSTAVPPGYTPPTAPQTRAVLDFAMTQLGKPYQWGGTGPDAYDCSGLMWASWAKGGITLPRTAAAQSKFGAPVTDPAQLQPGDLIFMPGANGSPASPGHVGMYIGNGQLINAPQTDDPVQIVPVSKWQGKISGMRRPGATNPDAPSPAVQA